MRINKHTVLAATLAVSIGVLPLAACGSAPTQEEAKPQETTQTEALDTKSWKTLGDALASRTDRLSYGHDDKYFVCVFSAGDTQVRAIAKSDPSIDPAIGELDFEDPDYDKKLDEILKDLELISAEDISGTMLEQSELDSYVGKTGQDLLDAGFVFGSYFMYGGEQTGASMDNGYYTYEFTFDVSVPEDKTEDEGEALKGATITEVQSNGNLSNMALDPASVE